ncbi:MAG: Hsp20/alpha crystallin family protein [Myxococcota bacterium]
MSDELEVKQQTPESDAPKGERTRPGRTYRPNVDIFETDEAIWLAADVPGVDEKSLEVRLEGDQLSIEGRVAIDEYADLTPVYSEYNIGDYERSFRLSDAIDSERIRARVHNGVLQVELPKVERMRPRQIPITPGPVAH